MVHDAHRHTTLPPLQSALMLTVRKYIYIQRSRRQANEQEQEAATKSFARFVPTAAEALIRHPKTYLGLYPITVRCRDKCARLSTMPRLASRSRVPHICCVYMCV